MAWWSKRTETMEVYAEPGGHFTAALHPGPRTGARNGGWVPVDTTLVRLARDGKGAALRWPGRLPELELEGATAADRLPAAAGHAFFADGRSQLN